MAVCSVAGIRHPANIPVARAKVQPDGSFEFTVTFDLLAFALDEEPTIIADAPMNGLLDGPSADLDKSLLDARKRFFGGLWVFARGVGPADPATAKVKFEQIQFPTAEDVHKWLAEGPAVRLPVMMSVSFTGHLTPGATALAWRFPDVMGTVVLTTEFPYKEPYSEPVEPGSMSEFLKIPTAAEVKALAASMVHPGGAATKPKDYAPTEATARAAIQTQYNRWSKAYMANDVPTLLDVLTPDYTLKTAKGALITHSEYAVMLDIRKKKHSDTKRYSTEISRMTLKGKVAAIYSRETTTNVETDPKSGRQVPLSYQHDYIDVWVLASGKWRLRSTVTQKEVPIK